MKRKTYKCGLMIEKVNEGCYTYEFVNKKFKNTLYFNSKEERELALENFRKIWELEGAKGFRVVSKGIFIE